MPDTRRTEALSLAEELLSDIEYTRIAPADIARKASRLARLVDDADAITWLRYEIGGYSKAEQGYMTDGEVSAAERSRRFLHVNDEGRRMYKVESIGEISAHIDAANAALSALGGSAATGQYAVLVENSRRDQRYAIWDRIATERGHLDAVLGAIHDYVAQQYQELRFGATVESAFEALRAEVDATVGSLVPNALPRLNAALENLTSPHPEHWANAASTCRRLLKEVADAIRPAGPDVEGRTMGEEQYVNRLVDWITHQPASGTLKEVVAADLEYLGHRLDAVGDAGHKGAHVDVSRFEASRFLVGTYLLLGDILRLGASPIETPDPARTGVGARAEELDPPPSATAPERPGQTAQASS